MSRAPCAVREGGELDIAGGGRRLWSGACLRSIQSVQTLPRGGE